MFFKNILCLCLLSILCIELCVGIEVKTTSGTVNGNTVRVLNTDINQYYNIPFAEPPVGALRFAKPVPLAKPREGVIDGTKWTSNKCLDVTEDCLVLNVFAPKVNDTNAPLKPVMFYIFGGGFSYGSPDLYNGTALAANDIVLVVTNYRLNAFGFFYGGEESAPGNLGLYDQNLALKWTRDNIHLFGGDKDKVTIFGESAGSMSVSAHILSPLSKGLFKRAIMQSGAQLGYNKNVVNTTQRLNECKDAAAKLNCTGAQWLDCLRKLDAKLIREMTINNFPLENTEFLPVSPSQEAFKTGKYNQDVDLIAGNVQNEAATTILTKVTRETIESTFVNKFNETFPGNDPKPALDFYLSTADQNYPESLAKAYADFSGDSGLACTTYAFATQFALNTPKSNVFYYLFNYNWVTINWRNPECNATIMGVCHASDNAFVFGDPITRREPHLQLEYDFSIEIMKLFTEFAKTGKPTTDTHKWPQLLNGTQTPKIKELNAFNFYRVYDDLYHYTCDGLFKNYF